MNSLRSQLKSVPSVIFMSLMLLAAPMVAACATEPSIQGRWSLVNGSDVLNFYADATLEIATPGLFGAQTQRGSYKFIDARHVTIKTETLFGTDTKTYEVRVSQQALSLTDASGKATHYQRVS